MVLTAVDGEGQNVQLATAYVHIKNKDNYILFIILCVQAGIPLHDCALFVDRGHSIPAASYLASRVFHGELSEKYFLNLKHCTMHIERNVGFCIVKGRLIFHICCTYMWYWHCMFYERS